MVTLDDIKKMEKPYEDIGMKVGEDNGPHPSGGGDSTSVKVGENSIVWRYHGSRRDGEVVYGTIVDAYMVKYGIDAKEAIKMLLQRYGDERVVDIDDFRKRTQSKKVESRERLTPVDISGEERIESYKDSQGKLRKRVYRKLGNLTIGEESFHHVTGGRNSEGDLVLIAVLRWEVDEGKCMRPFSKIGDEEWVLGTPKEYIRPLYKAYEISKSPDAQVWIVEGEKCMEVLQKACDEARRMHKDNFPEVIVTTSIGGSNAAPMSDWSVINQKIVRIIPDNDEGGYDYARFIAAQIEGSEVIGLDVGESEDIVDWLDKGNDIRELLKEDVLIDWAEEDKTDPHSDQYIILNSGSDVELSQILRARYDMIFDGENSWQYIERDKKYEELSMREMVEYLSMLDGVERSTGKPMNLSLSKIKAAISHAQEVTTDTTFFEGLVESVNFSDKIVKIENGRLVARDYRKSDKVRDKMDIPYDPYKTAPLFQRYLEDIFGDDPDGENKTAFLQEFAGACLFGMPHKYEKALILFGEGANGKSLFLDIFNSMFKDSDRSSISPQQLGDGSGRSEYYRAELVGRKINTIDEMPESDIMDSDGFKAIVTGNRISGRSPAGKPIFFQPRVGIVMSASTLPAVADVSYGFWRRWAIIEFNKTIPEKDRDPTLGHRIKTQERQGLLNWAIEGVQRLLERGEHYYVDVPSSDRAIHRWRNKADRIAYFLEMEGITEGGEDDWVQASDLYQRYKNWSSLNGYRAQGSQRFFEGVSKRFEKKKSGFIYYNCKIQS